MFYRSILMVFFLRQERTMVSVFLLGILRVSSFLLGRRLFGLVARWKRFEAHALFWALSVSKSQGWTNIVVEGDCKNIIDALNRDRKGVTTTPTMSLTRQSTNNSNKSTQSIHQYQSTNNTKLWTAI